MSYMISNLFPKSMFDKAPDFIDEMLKNEAIKQNRDINEANKLISFKQFNEEGLDLGTVLPQHATHVYVGYRWTE